MKNGLGLVLLRTLIGRTWWLPVLSLLATTATALALQSGDFTYTINSGNTNNTTVTVTGYTGPGGAIVIPSTIEGMSVTLIGNYAFKSCTNLTSAEIPDGVTSIGVEAFSYCTSLTSAEIPDGVTSIGVYAFAHCTSLTAAEIHDGVTDIGAGTFHGCTSLIFAIIGNGVTSIGDYAFYSCTSLTGVYFKGNAPIPAWYVFTGDDNATVYHLSGATGWPTTFRGIWAGRPTDLWRPDPILGPMLKVSQFWPIDGVTKYITINGRNFPSENITLSGGNLVSVTVEMNAGNYEGVPVDWWLLSYYNSNLDDGNSGWRYYTGIGPGLIWYDKWNVFNGDLADCHPIYQGPLFNLPSTVDSVEVLGSFLFPLSPGTYYLWFIVDYPMDGILNLDGQLLLYMLTMTVP